MKTLRIFISSPSDVRAERVRAYDVVCRLQTRYRDRLKLEPILWEDEVMRAVASFQSQIVPPSATDIVICILWSKIGTRLPQDYKRPDGTVPTGTEWEFEDAYRSYQVKGTPDLLVYHKTASPNVELNDYQVLQERIDQKKALDAFLNHWSRDHEGAFKAAFNKFETEEQFAQRLEHDLGAIIEKKIREAGPAGPDKLQITWFEGSPFRGLSAFQPEHAAIFFGRDLAVSEITQRLLAQAARGRVFLLVLGMSGCGKSSLVRAGVLPELQRPGVVDAVRCWRSLILRPGETSGPLIDGLASALLAGKSALPELAAVGYNAPRLAALLRDAPTHAIPPLEAALTLAAWQTTSASQRTTPPVTRLVLVIDQLEEIFTLERFDATQRTTFVAALSALARSGLVWVVATMRSDLYARCAELEELVALKGDDGQYDLSPPGISELGQMIRSPAHAAGLYFERHPVTRQQLDDALHEEAGKNPEVLPLLEFCLDELYKLKTDANLITWEAYEKLGGLKGAITKRAEEVYGRLSAQGREALPAVLGALIALGDTATARPASRLALARRPGGEEVVDAYVRANLLVTDINQTGEPVVALAHEALISGWARVQSWLRENEDFLRVKARIAHAAQRWREANRDRDYLLVEGKPLAEAEDAWKKRPGELEPDEIQFVAVSSTSAARQRRVRRLKAAAMLTLVLSLIFGAVLLWQVQQKHDAEAAANQARLATSETDAALAADQLHKSNVRVALAYLADALRNNPHNEKATALAVAILRDSPMPVFRFRHEDEVHDMAFSPDGERIVTACADGTACLWDAHTGQLVGRPLQHKPKAWVHAVAFSEDSNWVVTASWDGTARVWNARTAEARNRPGTTQPVVLEHKDRVAAACFSPDGRWIATGSWDKSAHVWDAQSGEPLRNAKGEPVELHHQGTVWSVTFSPNGRFLVTSSQDSTASLWDTQTWDRRFLWQHQDGVNGASFSPDGQRVVTGSDDNKARVWDLGSDQPLVEVEHRSGFLVVQPFFSPDGRWIVTASSDNTAQVWDAQKGTRRGEPMLHEGWVRVARFSPDGRLVATASYDGTARIWDAATGQPVSNPMYHGSAVYALNFSRDGRYLATASFDHFGRIWLVQGARVDKPMTHRDAISAARFSPNGQMLVTASADGTAQLWNASTREASGPPLPHDGAAVSSANFNADGSRLVTASADGKVRLWSTATGRQIGQPLSHAKVQFAQFSPQGRWIVTLSSSGEAQLWDAATGQPHGLPLPHGGMIGGVSFTPDDRWLLTACKDCKARIWDTQTGRLLRELPHNGGVESVAFGRFAVGDRILTASDDHSAQVWDANTGARLGLPMQHDGWVSSAEFSRDGTWVVTASADCTARVWDARTGRPVSIPMRHGNAVITANFSPDGRWVVTASADSSARIWDARTGLPVSGPLGHAKPLTAASFSPGGEWVLTASRDGTAHVWESVLTTPQAPDWLSRFIEEVGGLQLDANRNLVLNAADNADFRARFRQLPPSDELARFARWLVADPATRTVSPLSSLSVPEFVAQQLQAGDVGSVQAAYRADPGNPVVLATLAKFAPDRATAEFYCRLALQHARAGIAPVQTARVLAIGHSLFPDRAEFTAPAIVIP